MSEQKPDDNKKEYVDINNLPKEIQSIIKEEQTKNGINDQNTGTIFISSIKAFKIFKSQLSQLKTEKIQIESARIYWMKQCNKLQNILALKIQSKEQLYDKNMELIEENENLQIELQDKTQEIEELKKRLNEINLISKPQQNDFKQ